MTWSVDGERPDIAKERNEQQSLAFHSKAMGDSLYQEDTESDGAKFGLDDFRRVFDAAVADERDQFSYTMDLDNYPGYEAIQEMCEGIELEEGLSMSFDTLGTQGTIDLLVFWE